MTYYPHGCATAGGLMHILAVLIVVVSYHHADAAMLMPAYMTTQEVASYLRLKQRKIYELVRRQQIPCARITGKLLFPRQAIDLWVMRHLEGDRASAVSPPPVYAGSHDPLLEWA